MLHIKSEKFKLLRRAAYVGLPTLVLLLATTGFFWWQVIGAGEKLRHETMATSELRARQVNDALTEAVSMLFFNVDTALENLIDFYLENKGLAAFDQQAKVLLARFPAGSVMQVAVIGADGHLAYSNLGSQEKVYLGDREHFTAHLHNKTPQLFMSKPIMGRVSKKWTIQFSRPIMADGQLRGVMVFSVSPEYLYGTLSKLAQDTDDVILILRESGEIMARNRDFEATIGRASVQGRPYIGAPPGASGQFTATSSVDQVDRIYHWVRLKNYPVTVILGVSMNSLTRPVENAIADERFKAMLSTLAIWIISLLAVFTTLRMQAQIKKRLEFEYAANHDALTGLSNRKALLEQFQDSLQTNNNQPERSAVLFIDLDGFKPINDQYGHQAGDMLLKTIAQRIKGCARDGDLVARIGGDEFVLVLHHTHDDASVQAVVKRICKAVEAPIAFDNKHVTVGASVGVAIYPDQGQTTAELLEAADREMYRIKNERRSTQL